MQALSAPSYSGTYSGTLVPNPDMAALKLDHPVQSVEVPFVGATLSLGSKSVGMKVADTRIHYTNLEAQIDADGVICEDVKTFGGPRGVTGGYSARIQRRMFLSIRQFDISAIKNSADPLALIVFKFPEVIRTNRDLASKAMEKLIAAIKYKLGKMKAYPLVWNWEFHWSENVHFNFLMAFPSTSFDWLVKKWSEIAGHAADALGSNVLHVSRFADFDDAGNEISFEEQFYSAAAYMAGLGELLGRAKAHQYDIPEDWTAPGVGSGRMWGARGLKRAKVVTYPVENLAQKQAIEVYMAPRCAKKLVEYWNPATGETTVFNDGAFSPSRRAGSVQCLDVTEEMHEDILDLLELHATPVVVELVPEFTEDYAEEPNARLLAAQARRLMRSFWEQDGFDAAEFMAAQDEDLTAPPMTDADVEAAEVRRPLSELLGDAAFAQFLVDADFSPKEQSKAVKTAVRQSSKTKQIVFTEND